MTGSTEIDDIVSGKEAWTKDKEARYCEECNRRFTAYHRRHHCRLCGHCICSGCSKRRAVVEGMGNKPVRVCDRCVRENFDVEAVDKGCRWTADQDAEVCEVCKTQKFTTTKRRHHCRMCGKVCCQRCSRSRTKLPRSGNKKVRVCDLCVKANPDMKVTRRGTLGF